MDPQYYTRIAMAGWVFLAVILATLWGSGSPQWDTLLQLLQQKEISGAVALFGAIVGIGAPPAFGFLLERIATMMLWVFRRTSNMWHYTSMAKFRDHLASAMKDQNIHSPVGTDGALFHIFFYTHADEKVIDWARRRRTAQYASLTSALAIVFGLLLSFLLFRAFSWSVALSSLLLAAILLAHARRENNIHQQAIAAWINTMGVRVSKDFAKQLALSKGEVEDGPPHSTSK